MELSQKRTFATLKERERTAKLEYLSKIMPEHTLNIYINE